MKVVSIFSILAFLALGCKKSSTDSTDNSKSSDTFPNKPGDSWIYHVIDTVTERTGDLITEYDMTVYVTDSIRLPGGVVANIWVYHSPNNSDTNYVYKDVDTVKFLDRAKASIVRQYVIPLSVHKSWPYIPGFSGVTIDAQQQIKVGGNTFNDAFHLTGSAGLPDATFEVDEWIVNNIGVVKRYINPNGLILSRHPYSWTLVSYHLN